MAKQAEWCRQYAKVNAAGLRKIAKKHDKRVSSDAGHRFVQVRSSLYTHCRWIEPLSLESRECRQRYRKAEIRSDTLGKGACFVQG